MNREIKFRAWDGKKMYLPEYSDKEDFHILPDGTIVETHEHGPDRHELTTPRGPNWLLMQYTGIKDKNGKDIYEGDILKFHYFFGILGPNMGVAESEHELTGIIEFEELGLGLRAIKGEHWKGYTGYADGECDSSVLALYAMNEGAIHEESFEIIGNIHDNPELLQGVKHG